MVTTLIWGTSAGVAATTSLGVLAAMTLLGILVTKEFTRDNSSPRLRRLQDILNVAIVPLVLAFLIVVAVQVIRVLH